MATHTINSESTPTPPRFQSAVVVPMPYPGARRSSFLRAPECHQVSRKVTIWVRFIERWQKRNCAVYRGIVRRLQTIYGQTRQIGDQLFLIRLGKEYKNQDLAQQVSSHAYLETFKDKPRSDNSEVLQFCQQFSDIFLVLKMILTETLKRPVMNSEKRYIMEDWIFRKGIDWEREVGFHSRQMISSGTPFFNPVQAT